MFAHGSLRTGALPSLRAGSSGRLYCLSSAWACCCLSLSWTMIGSSSRDFCAKTGPPRSPSTMALATIFFMALNPGNTSPVDSNMAWGSAQCDQIVAQWTVLLGIRLRLTGHFGGFAHVIVAPDSAAFGTGPPRHDWTREQVRALFAAPFPDLMFRAGQVHRENFDSSEVQISTLLS